MIFQELRFSNFLNFPGEQGITIPTNSDCNLIVILAPNNTGKTSLIRTLKFLLYGHLSGTVKGSEHKLLNDSKKASTATGSELSGWVEATYERDGETRCVRRTLVAKKTAPDTWRTVEVKLEEVRRGGTTRFIPDKEGSIQRDLRRLVPEMLFDAFYFQGEPLKGELLGDIRSIRESLNSFLHEDRWEQAQNAAEAAREYYAKELQKVAGKNTEYQTKLQEEESFKKQLSKYHNDLQEKNAKLLEATERFEQTTQALQELGKPAEAQRLLAELRDLTGHRDRAKRNRAQLESELTRLVGNSCGISFVLSALPKAQIILSEMQNANILPADVTEGFVERVLAQPQCVCGHVHDSKTRASWTSYKAKTLSADLNRGLSDLLDSVGDSGRHSYTARARTLADALSEKRRLRAKSIVDEQKFEGAVREAEERRNSFPVEEVRRLGVLLSSIAAERQSLGAEVQRTETAMKVAKTKCEALAAELVKIAPKGASSAMMKKIKQAGERAENLRILIQNSRERLNQAFHEILQRSVARYYDGTAYDGSRAKINPYTLLPAVEVNGEIRKNLGGGQSQLLALAYIVSLARLRKSLHAEMMRLGVSLGRLDDQSFFLDSPFDKMTDTYALRIADFLTGSARQIILMLARQQWELVSEKIEPFAGRIYMFHYHTTLEKVRSLPPEDFVYEVRGTQNSLLHTLPVSERNPYTEVKELN